MKSIFGLLLSNSTDATFRAWGSALSAQIGSMLTRVPQTGDINWSTINKPGAANVYVGSEVFRFNDPLQTTHPLFLKFEYGAGSTAGTVGLQMTVGKSADGLGNIGGVLLAATQIVQAGATATVISNSFISAGSSWFALSLDPATSGLGGLVYIERSLNSGGQPTSDALMIGWQTRAGVNQAHRFIDYANLTTEIVDGGIVSLPVPLSTDRSIANGNTGPIFSAGCMSPSGMIWRPDVINGTARVNAGLGEVVYSLRNGNAYLSLGVGAQRSDQRNGTFATTLIRWDD